MKAWIARDNHKVAHLEPIVVLFWGVKPELGVDGTWRQHYTSNAPNSEFLSRWPLPLDIFAPFKVGELRRVRMEWEDEP